ncbi:16S rRNA (uracil(1498)-N(3))-methyltransferase [Lysobacteraceae bacterium NML120232]|nr:16S rRNA (uracil(1498)-N(3))-methyltransferase [Xanthomonadaceae bacterium NML120232]
MRLTRTWIDRPLTIGQRLALPENAANHLLRVLRLASGDACVLFNGDGHDYLARIGQVSKRECEVEIIAAEKVERESPLAITLLQGIARGEKMDLILQKATELGAAAFMPVSSQRSEVKLDAARAEKRLAHWQGVVMAACEQSGRAVCPPVAAPLPLATALQHPALPAARFYLDPEATQRISTLAIDTPALAIAVGPEGGWSARDLQELRSAGFIGLRLGPRILRTETAGLAAISALQLRLGDIG